MEERRKKICKRKKSMSEKERKKELSVSERKRE